MSEDYRIVSPPRGDPRSLGDVGVQLSGRPSRRWSRDLGARLTRELVGHPGAAHLRVNVNELVLGDEIVLDGVEDREMPALADALRRAVDAANRAAIDEGDRGAGDQLALSEMDCPSCGTRLVRAVEGHADHGWCLVE
jgi:hypothetical protein